MGTEHGEDGTLQIDVKLPSKAVDECSDIEGSEWQYKACKSPFNWLFYGGVTGEQALFPHVCHSCFPTSLPYLLLIPSSVLLEIATLATDALDVVRGFQCPSAGSQRNDRLRLLNRSVPEAFPWLSKSGFGKLTLCML